MLKGYGLSVENAFLVLSFEPKVKVYVRNFILVPSLIEGLRVAQGLRVVPVFLYRYSMKSSLKKARSPGTTEGGRSD
jgi:hypothetical protein